MIFARQVEVYFVRSWQTNKFSFNEDNPLGKKVQHKIPSAPAPAHNYSGRGALAEAMGIQSALYSYP